MNESGIDNNENGGDAMPEPEKKKRSILERLGLSKSEVDDLRVELSTEPVDEPAAEDVEEPEAVDADTAEDVDADGEPSEVEELRAKLEEAIAERDALRERAEHHLSKRTEVLINSRKVSPDAVADISVADDPSEVDAKIAEAIRKGPMVAALSRPVVKQPDTDEPNTEREAFRILLGRYPKDGEVGERELSRMKEHYPEHFASV